MFPEDAFVIVADFGSARDGPASGKEKVIPALPLPSYRPMLS